MFSKNELEYLENALVTEISMMKKRSINDVTEHEELLNKIRLIIEEMNE